MLTITNINDAMPDAFPRTNAIKRILHLDRDILFGVLQRRS